MASRKDNILVLIEMYNRNPQAPLKGRDITSQKTRYEFEFMRDRERIRLEEYHYVLHSSRKREIEISVGQIYIKSLACIMPLAIAKIANNWTSLEESGLEPTIEKLDCHNFGPEVKIIHQTKCARLALDVIKELSAGDWLLTRNEANK